MIYTTTHGYVLYKLSFFRFRSPKLNSLDKVIAQISKQKSVSITTTPITTSNSTSSIDPVLIAPNEVICYSEQKPLHEIKI